MSNFSQGRNTLHVASILLLLAVTGCQTATIEDAAPSPAASASNPPAPPLSSGPANTGAYPNINVMPSGAAAQLSDDEAAAKKAELLAQAEAQRVHGESAEAYLARLRKLQKLGSTHAAAALAAIEASQ